MLRSLFSGIYQSRLTPNSGGEVLTFHSVLTASAFGYQSC